MHKVIYVKTLNGLGTRKQNITYEWEKANLKPTNYLSLTVQIKSIFIMTNIRCREERIVKPIDDVENHLKTGVD